jgi:putative ABC transport system ATP-binding protein
VAVARALVSNPEIILADEPTGNLDTRAGDEIARLLRQASKEWNRTVIMVTHDPRIAAYADRLIFLKDGHITEQTTLETKNSGRAEGIAEKMKGLA